MRETSANRKPAIRSPHRQGSAALAAKPADLPVAQPSKFELIIKSQTTGAAVVQIEPEATKADFLGIIRKGCIKWPPISGTEPASPKTLRPVQPKVSAVQLKVVAATLYQDAFGAPLEQF